MGKNLLTYAIVSLGLLSTVTMADITVSVSANSNAKKISPYIYGRNIDTIGDTEESDPEKAAELLKKERAFYQKMQEAGFHFLRANTGNNATRYNWRKKLTVHPDWYNNVNPHDWDITAKKIQDNLPGVDAMYAFQLTGYAAKTSEYNFGDWDFYINHNNTWATSTLDLAGGGEVMDDGKTLIKAGDYSLYNESWPADSTVGIIDHWKNKLKYDMSRFQYWSMDNEMDIWAGTHGDLPLNISGKFLVDRYVEVAKKAREAWPDIKLTGPVAANEWYWCSISYKGGTSGRIKKESSGEDRDYCWLEYFIKKVAEAEKATGKRLLDVFDIHWYPSEKSYEDRINWHRVFFDTTYIYPGANSIKQVNGGWDETINKEFIFKRINDWLDKYFGKNHGITLALTEGDYITGDAMLNAIIYASILGTFMNNGVEIFTPWTWGDGLYETVHLFSRYGHENLAESRSSNDSLVSAYSSFAKDSLTVILVNRSEKQSQPVHVDINGFASKQDAKKMTLSGLTGETFESHEKNALKSESVEIKTKDSESSERYVELTLPAKSITALVLASEVSTDGARKLPIAVPQNLLVNVNGSWAVNNSSGSVRRVDVFDIMGKQVYSLLALAKGNVALNGLVPGNYVVRISEGNAFQSRRIVVK